MINVSNAFREQLNNDNRNYLCYVKITLHDETVLNVENDKLWSSGVEIERAVSSDNTFDIGSVIINKATIVLNNIYDDFTEYDFSDATVYIEIGLELENETIERVKLGTFYVDEPKYNGSLISLECLDSMSRFDVDYSESNLTYPATLLEIVRDACSACGVTSGIATLPNGDYTVEEKPDVESLTFRQVLQWAAQICCQWFTIDENDRLVSGWYVVPDEDSGYHTLSGVNSITVDTDDVVITGIKVTEFVEDTDEDPAVYQSGNDGYVLGISENKLITTGKGSAVAVYLGQQLIGMRFRPFSATCQNDPTIEAGDPVSISDYKGNVFHSFVTNFKFTTWNSENFSCGAESAKRKSASRYSQLTQAYVQNRKNMRKQKTEFEKQMEELANRINTSSGLYMTEEVQEDGSTIYYLHNKPTLEESMIIWKMTAEAFAVSNDGGKSWSAGLTVDGELIAKIMNTIGINFDWGVGGSLVITDKEGNETFYANAETGEVRIVATSFILNGKTVQQITQEVAGEVAKEEAENTIGEFVQGEYKDTIQDIYNSLDQKSETWYQATDPALEWTEIESTPLQDTTGANILDTAEETIITIWEKEKSLHNGDLWKNSTTNKEYLYQNGEWVEMPIPDEVFDMIDGKAQIFVVQPTPPYDVGDVWFTGTTILVCNTKRENGSFSESDWGKKDNYTDDSALYEFIEGDYSETVENLKNQADKKAETWYQSTDPSTGWTAAEKQVHTGDLWYNTSDEKTYIYNGSAWELTKTTPPDEVFDAIDGKAQIFVSQPKPPYSVGDLWFNSATSDIMTCINSRSTGNYTASDWQKRNKYTDDSYAQEVNQELNQFITDYQDEIKEIQNQVDQKAETWYQTSDPALQWTGKENIPLADTTGASILDTTGATITTIRESEKMLHDGDLWHNPSNNNEYIYQDGEWHKTSIPDDVFDIIDGKAQIFVATPTPPYDVGDLWFNSATSDIMTCVQSRSSGSYTAGDWQKRNKYTDDSYAEKVEDDLSNAINGLDESLTQQEIFNRLTNNGQTQGLYLQNGKLYINGSYIQSGTISGDYIKGGTIEGTTVKGGTVEGSTVKGGTVEGSTVKGGTIEGSVYRYGDDTAYIKLSNGKLFSTNGERAVKISGYNIEIGEKADSEEDIVEGLNSTSISDYGARIACKKSDLIPSIGNNGYVDIGIESIGGMDAFSPIFYKNNDTGDSGYAVVSENANNFNFVYRASGQGGPYLEFYTLFGAYGVNAWSSDIREKEQIEESHSVGIETINKFKHRRFRWKDVVDGLGEKHEGFYVDCGYIAQEMQEINPQFVITVAKGTKSERLQISEQSIIPYITKAIQELSEENKSLRKEIEEIKAMLRREE